MFMMGIERGQVNIDYVFLILCDGYKYRLQFAEDQKLPDGSEMKISKIYPLDATFDTKELIPQEVFTNIG